MCPDSVSLPHVCSDSVALLRTSAFQLKYRSQNINRINKIDLTQLEGYRNFDQIGANWGVLRPVSLSNGDVSVNIVHRTVCVCVCVCVCKYIRAHRGHKYIHRIKRVTEPIWHATHKHTFECSVRTLRESFSNVSQRRRYETWVRRDSDQTGKRM